MAGVMPLLLRLAGAYYATLARQVEYLVIENRILRSKIPGQIRLTEQDCQACFREPAGPQCRVKIRGSPD
jgi:hypothetical protein